MKIVCLFVFCTIASWLLCLSTVYCQSWGQIGEDINGEDSFDYSGYSVSLSGNGQTVAIGAQRNDGIGKLEEDNSGHVRIYKLLEDSWLQVGNDIDGEEGFDYSGDCVSLSSDGQIVAIGAPFNDGNGNSSGHVRIYFLNGSVWAQLGDDIDGEDSMDYSGDAVSLSSDGQTVAIGAPFNDGNGENSGHVRIYKWSGESWLQVGGDIDGAYVNERSGYSVSLSSNGQIVAIGAPYNSVNGNSYGRVRIYSWNGSNWTQVGDDIYGEEEGDLCGYSLSLSSDGQKVAIGSPFNSGNGNNSGHVRIYNWSGSAWVQLGDEINGEEEGDLHGYSVSTSNNGLSVAIGAPHIDQNEVSSGYVQIYNWSGSNWSQVGDNIDGEDAGDRSGEAVTLSDNGQIVAVGAPYNDAIGYSSGHVRVFMSPIGCTDFTACNYSPLATEDDGSCEEYDECGECGGFGAVYECGCSDIPEGDCDCNGNILDALGICGGDCASDADNDGICDNEDPCFGVIDECEVCNGPGAIYQCGCSDIPEGDCDCDGTPLSPVVLECDCDEALTYLVEETITNFDDCTITEACYCECINDTDQDGVCNELEWAGCQDQSACNYNPNSTDEDNSLCIYPGNDCDDLNPLTFLDYVNEDCFCGGFEVTGIDENSSTSISVYPNPCSSSFIINTGRKPQYSDYRLYDMTGKEVHRGFVGSGITNIEINTLASGIYTLVVLSKDGDAFRQSLVVQREE